MSFFSIEFSTLLLIFFSLYWAVKSFKIQNLLLLGFNYLVIYLFSPYFALIVGIYTCLVYVLAFFIDTARLRFVFFACVFVCILFLCFFKYYANIKDEFDALLMLFGLDFLESDIIFPLGLSFYTFNSITYLRQVYEEGKNLIRDEYDGEYCEEQNPALQSFTALATYLSFFATFLAGPIMRSHFFFRQYHAKRELGSIDLIIALILFGVVKKVFIANYAQIYAAPIFNAPFSYHSLELLCAMFAYSVQIYCDFSGYVNLVCAFGLVLGFTLPLNFNMPYMAKNLKDFWNRWHISLSTFIRDYIYIPLGGNRNGFLMTQILVLFAFGLSGLWHGDTWTFLIWGLLHGFGLVVLNCYKQLGLPKLPFGGASLTFLFVSLCWIFFYYHSLEEAINFFLAMYQNFSLTPPVYAYGVLMGFVAFFLIYPFMAHTLESIQRIFSLMPLVLKPIVLAVLFTLIVGFMPSGIPNFIYASF
ncbi:alginate O-acetyltransferase [Helicobacter cinaedi]|uniref:Alginate O-acetyltransferase n=1 Tax=Helicobacter cinaedi TaxID=213 RepID=A0A377JQL9_9HELI|nr:MBOAT family O-acyltransferase [Helicobacter cinaedi]STP10228.1 alginate O-acetyltransferase [Helicobacter cinaedi]